MRQFLLYHWLPKIRRASIKRHGLVVGSKYAVHSQGWRAIYLCFSVLPQTDDSKPKIAAAKVRTSIQRLFHMTVSQFIVQTVNEIREAAKTANLVPSPMAEFQLSLDSDGHVAETGKGESKLNLTVSMIGE
jgi:hypothetical protein